MEQFFLIVFYLIILIYSIILHEVSHGVVALWLGDKTAKYAGRLSLEPLRHIDLIGSIVLPIVMIVMTGFAFGWAKPVPYNPNNLRIKKWGEVIVAFSGPITNYIIALIAALIASMINVSVDQKMIVINNLMSAQWYAVAQNIVGSPAMVLFTLCAMVIFWNVLLGTFNIIPIPPLDGSKILYVFFRMRPQTQMFFEQWGFLIIIALLVIPVFSSIFYGGIMFMWNIFFYLSL
ncbi:MAG: site-2 protease family protein [Parcubacteria group bacterium]|jgi:Zn-dependent protease